MPGWGIKKVFVGHTLKSASGSKDNCYGPDSGSPRLSYESKQIFMGD